LQDILSNDFFEKYNHDLFLIALREKLLQLEEYGLTNLQAPPALDDKCGKFLRFRDLIQVGETVNKSRIPNTPKSIDSYRALLLLSENILDPVIEWFGSIEITYGFCSDELRKLIRHRVAPKLDQHVSHETSVSGKFICERIGAAVDFYIKDEDMEEVARWIIRNTPFDRLYFYGVDRPIHVSYGPDNSRVAFFMKEASDGRRYPQSFKNQEP